MENLVFLLIKRGFGWNIIREIFTTLDSVAFFLFSKVMQLMFDIVVVTASADLNELFGTFYSRVYAILSLYMFFKVTVSILSYMVNPDSMTDKNTGVGKLVQRIIVALIMLMFFPTAFATLNDLQSHIIANDTISKLVLGPSGSYDDPEGIGTDIAYNIYNGTFMYREGCDPKDNPDGCKIHDSDEHTVASLIELVNEPVDGNPHEYKYGYMPFIGCIVGIAFTIFALGMCVDVAVRVFKLMILQLVAPIPILSYVDPKSSKDGAFSKWLKMIVTVWSEVFARLFIIYFILLVIEMLINSGDAFGETSVFVKIALIIGLLFFAKDAPKFIFDSLGIKSPDTRSMTGTLGRAALGGAGALVAGGGLGGMAAGAFNGFNVGMQGGKVGDALKQGLDLGTQAKTGGEQTKYKTLAQRAQQKAMQAQAAKKLGFSSIRDANEQWANLKAQKLKANDRYQNALMAYQNGEEFSLTDDQGNVIGGPYKGEALRRLITGFDTVDKNGNKVHQDGLRDKANKAESKFNDVTSFMASHGMGSKSETDLKKAQGGRAFFTGDKKSAPQDKIDISKFPTSGSNPVNTAANNANSPQPYAETDPLDLMSRVQSEQNERMMREANARKIIDGIANDMYAESVGDFNGSFNPIINESNLVGPTTPKDSYDTEYYESILEPQYDELEKDVPLSGYSAPIADDKSSSLLDNSPINLNHDTTSSNNNLDVSNSTSTSSSNIPTKSTRQTKNVEQAKPIGQDKPISSNDKNKL